MTLVDNQWSYNGLLFGQSTPIKVVTSDGISRPTSRVLDISRPVDHGSFIFGQYTEARRLTLEGIIVGPGTNPTLYGVGGYGLGGYGGMTEVGLENLLRSAFTPQSSDLPLSFQDTGDVTKRINCIPTNLHITGDVMRSAGRLVRFVLELTAGDPRIYSDTAHTLAVASSGTANNAGVIASPPTVRIDGPITNPKVSGPGGFILLSTTIIAGNYVTIDFGARTILLNGSTSIYSTLDTTSTWWGLLPGNNTVSLTGTGTSGATLLTVTWRDAWI